MSSSTNTTFKYPCPHCNLVTSHSASPDASGGTLTCLLCKRVSARLSLADMMAQIRGRLGHEPPFEISTADAKSVKVFIKHGTSDDGEAEVSVENVQQHLRITGALPAVGNKLMAIPKGMSHKAFAIPIGDVVRVEPVH